MSSVRHLTRHALHRTLAVLSLPFRAIEPPEEKEQRDREKEVGISTLHKDGTQEVYLC